MLTHNNHHHRSAVLGAAGLLLVLCAAPAMASPVFKLEDIRRIVRVSDAAISPDGKQVAVIVSTPNWTTDKSVQEIELIDTATGARRTLTWKRSGLSSPRWSEDGTRLAFLAEDVVPPADGAAGAAHATGNRRDHERDDAAADDKQPQVFVMPMNGGDAIRVTDAPHGVDEYAWSPDGTQIAYLAADDAPNAKAIKAHDDAFQVTDNHFLTRAALTPSHLWVVPSTGGSARRLTQGTFSLNTDQQDDAPAPQWSRDGHRIIVTRYPGPYYGPSYQSVIADVAVEGGDLHTLQAAEGSWHAGYAPNGEALAFLRARGGDQNNGAALYVMTHGQVVDLSRALDRNISNYRWLPDGSGLLMSGMDGTHAALWHQPLQGAAQRLQLGNVEASEDFSVANTGAVAFIGATAAHPGELYVVDAAGGAPRRLTHLNDFVDQLSLGRVTTVEWRGPQGFAEDGVLIYPPDYQPAHRYPLVLVIHGGPGAASTERFSAQPQLLAAAGFLVFEPNYRGSINRGDAYQHAIYRDTGDGPGKDVMAGLAAVEKLRIVDTSRIGVSGWSYGGYMTTWLTGHYNVWKAAVAGAALTDWVMDYTVAFYQRGDVYLFGGSPWDARYRPLWLQQSPIQYASHVHAPTLILGDVGDPNVPLLNSYEWYHALRDAGVPVDFYAYPVDTHFPKDVVRTTDVYRRWVAWMTDKLK